MHTADTGTIIMDMGNLESDQDLIGNDEAVAFLGQTVDDWFAGEQSQAENNRFAINIAHWALETFGQQDNEDFYYLSTQNSEGKYGFAGEELPLQMHQLVTYEYKGELHMHDENNIGMKSQSKFIETDSHIPHWDEIKQLPTFEEQLEAVRSNPEIRNGIVPTKVGVVPQVSFSFKPAFHYYWGIQFLVNELGVEVAPYGDYGKTWTPLHYAVETQAHPRELAEVICRLSILTAKHTYQPSRDYIPASVKGTLQSRLAGEEPIPLNLAGFMPKPGSSVKNLIISRLAIENAPD